MKTRKVRQRQWQRWLLHMESMERKAGNDPAKSGRCLFRISTNAWDRWVGEYVSEHAYRVYKRSRQMPAVTFEQVVRKELEERTYQHFEDAVLGDLTKPPKLIGILNRPDIQIKDV